MEHLLDIIKCSICETNWYYKGEGNANLIIAMKNEPTVIRISKHNFIKENITTCQTVETNINLKIAQISEEYLKFRQNILYYEKVILPLFTNFYFQIPKLGFINKNQTEILIKNLKHSRPQFRQNKIIHPGFVLIFRDLTFLPKHLSYNENSNIVDSGHILNSFESKYEANIICKETLNLEKEKSVRKIKPFDQGQTNKGNYFEEVKVSLKYLMREFQGDEIHEKKLYITSQDGKKIVQENELVQAQEKAENDSKYEKSTKNNTSKIKPHHTDNIHENFNPVYCIEIKPKQGWLAYSDRKFSKCSFCLNQYLKLSENSIPTLSKYCPLDLFSGNQLRMIQSIKGLLSTPQNNIRIFQNGILIWGENSNESIYDFLEHFSRFNLMKNKNVENIDNFCSLILNMLMKNMTGMDDSNDFLFNQLIACENTKEKHFVDHTCMKSKITSLIKNTPEDNICELLNTDEINQSMQTIQNDDKILQQNTELISSETDIESNSKTFNETHPNKLKTCPNRIPVHSIEKLKRLLLPLPCCNFSTEKLPFNSLLDIILKIQKLDIYGADCVYNLYKNLYCKVDSSFCDEYKKILTPISESKIQNTGNILDPIEANIVKELKKSYDESKMNEKIHADISSANENNENVSPEKIMKKSNAKENTYIEPKNYVNKLISSFPSRLSPIESYALSTMAKDCSILISFQHINKNETNIPLHNIEKDLIGNEFIFNINIADIDAKPLSCIEKHYKRDHAIVKACIAILEKNQGF